jgi:hypothetical protein
MGQGEPCDAQALEPDTPWYNYDWLRPNRVNPATLSWLGRVQAAFMDLPITLSVPLGVAITTLAPNGSAMELNTAENTVRRLLQAAHWRLHQATNCPTTLAVGTGMVFDYFNGVADIIKAARTDVLFLDPYLDDEFIRRFLPSIDPSVPVRLLGRERQSSTTIRLRSGRPRAFMIGTCL